MKVEYKAEGKIEVPSHQLDEYIGDAQLLQDGKLWELILKKIDKGLKEVQCVLDSSDDILSIKYSQGRKEELTQLKKIKDFYSPENLDKWLKMRAGLAKKEV